MKLLSFLTYGRTLILVKPIHYSQTFQSHGHNISSANFVDHCLMEEILEFHCRPLESYLLWFHENIFVQTIILLYRGETTILTVLLPALLYSRTYYNRYHTISKLGPSGHLFFLSCGETLSLQTYQTVPLDNFLT